MLALLDASPLSRGLALVLLFVAVGACDGEGPLTARFAGPPTVETRHARLLPLAVMPVALANPSDRQWAYGACNHLLERREGDAWVYFGHSGPCLDTGHSLAPSGRALIHVPLPGQQGTYRIGVRFSNNVDGMPERVLSMSNAFVVGAASADADR